MELLLSKDADPNIAPSDPRNGNYSALLYASGRGHTEIVKLLLDKRANITRYEIFDGKNSLSFASENGHVEIVKLLLKKYIKFKDSFTYTDDINKAYQYAILNKHKDPVKSKKIIRLLLEAKGEKESEIIDLISLWSKRW